MKQFLLTSLALLAFFVAPAQQQNPLLVKDQLAAQQHWVDSIYDNMSLQEKVGQLFMVDVFSRDPKSKTDLVKGLIENYYLGGVIFSKGGPVRQAKLNNEFQALSKVPLMVGMDAEWGLAMRLDSTFAYPWNMTLGAVRDDRLIEQVGRRIGEHCKRLGVHINFAPVVDINTNPKNPIIGNRSFGESRAQVSRKSSAFLKGIQAAGILGSAKHFPGHGDTDADSHKTLPTIPFSQSRIDSLELFPYKRLISEGLSSVMVAHLNIPSLIPEDGLPSSLSKAVVQDLLQGQLGFNGLIFTDALNMKGAANFDQPGAIDLAAFLAGNDILLISEDVPKAHQLLVKAYREGVVTEARLAHSVKKILMAKYKAGLHNYQPVETANLFQDLNTPQDDALYEAVMESALTVVKNDLNMIPIQDLSSSKLAYVHLGDDPGESFYNQLRKYTAIDRVKAATPEAYLQKLKTYDKVIIGYHKSNANPWKDHDMSEDERVLIQRLADEHMLSLVVFAKPYALLELPSFSSIESMVLAYQNSPVMQSLAAQLLFGARIAKGQLPVGLGDDLAWGHGLSTRGVDRLQYGSPASVGLDAMTLKKIDSMARVGVASGMMPGAQILVARKGKVVYDRYFGYHTPGKQREVDQNSVYDVASLTKILATVPLLMELFDRGVLNMDTTLGEILPEYKGTDKEKIDLKRMLSHFARLKAWIPFYTQTLDSLGRPDAKFYRKIKDSVFSVQVADNLYMRADYQDSIYKQIRESELRPRRGYKYSDLPYYLLKKFIEEYYDQPMDELVSKRFYRSMGAQRTTYNPLSKISLQDIPPTEDDNYFRMQAVQGYVHDQGAAMMGGVSGHAGLFSNSNDVAKLMQMYLWKGHYGGKQYVSAATIDSFNTCHYCEEDVRRGVGFDKPQLGDVGPTCGCVSMTSFGHSGFTGTFTWADPEQEIVYVFLSNRTFPTAENRSLIRSDLRSNIQGVIYEAITD